MSLMRYSMNLIKVNLKNKWNMCYQGKTSQTTISLLGRITVNGRTPLW